MPAKAPAEESKNPYHSQHLENLKRKGQPKKLRTIKSSDPIYNLKSKHI